MKLNCNSFVDGNFTKIDLNHFHMIQGLTPNDPAAMQSALNILHKDINGNHIYTYGGYGEDRRNMFKGTYLEKTNKYYHLGIDINVLAGTPVKCPFDCIVVDNFTDKDKEIGWGRKINYRIETSSSWYLFNYSAFRT